MKNKIHTIEVENNETQSVEKIIEKIRENKIIYVKNKFYEDKDVLDSITENGPAIILNSSGSSGKPRQCFHHLNNLKLSATTSGQWLIEQGFELQNCFGSTETAAMVTSLKPKEFLMGFKNVGEILPDTKIRINAQGLIEIKSARIGIEIIDSLKTENFKNKNGWWQTSDLGEIKQINNSYYLKFVGRSDNAFNSGGEVVFPEVIESRLNDFIMKENIPINKFNISKVSNKLWGNKIKVIVEFRELTNDKNIEISLNLLKNFSQSWPKHEKPEKWIVKNKNSITEKINYKFKK